MKPIIAPEIEAKIAATVEAQKADDGVGNIAVTAAVPGPVRDIWAPKPSIAVGPFTVRRFVDRDFIILDALQHPLKSLSALADQTYNFEPSGREAWDICWLMTRPVAEVKEVFRTGGRESAQSMAEETFGDLDVPQIAALLAAVARQLGIYASAHIELKDNEPEGENSPNPPSSQP